MTTLERSKRNDLKNGETGAIRPPLPSRLESEVSAVAPARVGAGRCLSRARSSGIGGWYPERRPEGPGDVQQQTADALTIMKQSLEKSGSSMANVLKVQVALVDPENNWEKMNEVYNGFFPEPRPVRSYFGATGFRRAGQLLQIDCIPYVD